MLAGLEVPWSCHVDCDADCVSWEGFDDGFGASSVAVCESDDTDDAFDDPDRDDAVYESDLREIGEL